MCGRYTLFELEDFVEKWGKIEAGLRPNYNVAPTQTMPVVTSSSGKEQVELMHWGIPRVLGKDFVKEIINTRADKAFGGFWKKNVVERRCLVPANGFYEWKKTPDGKVPYFIHPKDQSLFTFAGIWSHWEGKDGKEFNAYSIMTTEPNKEMKDIHDRMPVILHPEDELAWLHADNEHDISSLLKPYDNNGLELYEVSKDVNTVRINNKELLGPVNSA